VSVIAQETDAAVRRSSIAALSCITSRTEGAVHLAGLSDSLALLVACIAKTSEALHPVADVAKSTLGARAVLAAGAVPIVVEFLRPPKPSPARSAAPAAWPLQPPLFYPVLKTRDARTDAHDVLRSVAEHDPGRDALIACGAPAVFASELQALSDAPSRTPVAALGAVAALAGSVPGVLSLLKEGIAPFVVKRLISAVHPVAEQALVTAKQLVTAPAGRRSVCASLAANQLLFLRVFSPPTLAVCDLVELLNSPSPGPSPDATSSAALALLFSLADPGTHVAGPEAAAAAIAAMSRASCLQRLRDIAHSGTLEGDSFKAAQLLKLL
jgi:hypothetical protein